MSKPKVTTNPVANQYTRSNERIIEFSDRQVQTANGPVGGLIQFHRSFENRTLVVQLYRLDPEVVVRVSPSDRQARDDRTVWRVTAADLDALAGRELTEEELQRVAKAIDHSTAGEAVEAAVEQVAGLRDDENEEVTAP